MNSGAVEHASEIMEANGSLPVTYDAFISYSHAKDKPLAMALQAVVQRLGKPWYRRRALRLFRDDTSLSATPKLWPSIKFALAKSRFLILLASPEAAVSHWVGQEVAYWLDHNGTETLLIALTEGELTWDIASRDFLWSQLTPLPAVLKNRFSTEPRWIDLRGRREAGSAKGPDFVDLAADFAAAIHGTAKEDLLSQEVRQQRRALTLAWSAAALLFVLVVAAAGLAAFGFNRAQEAARERDLAETSSREAERQRDIAVNKSKEAAARLADAQRSQSRFLADAARQENKTGDHATALALALEALPDPSRGINRPYVAEAEKGALCGAKRCSRSCGISRPTGESELGGFLSGRETLLNNIGLQRSVDLEFCRREIHLSYGTLRSGHVRIILTRRQPRGLRISGQDREGVGCVLRQGIICADRSRRPSEFRRFFE